MLSTDIHDLLGVNVLGKLDTLDALSAKQRREWADWARNVDRYFEDAQKAIALGVRFFSDESFALLQHPATDLQEKQRLADRRWDSEKCSAVPR